MHYPSDHRENPMRQFILYICHTHLEIKNAAGSKNIDNLLPPPKSYKITSVQWCCFSKWILSGCLYIKKQLSMFKATTVYFIMALKNSGKRPSDATNFINAFTLLIHKGEKGKKYFIFSPLGSSHFCNGNKRVKYCCAAYKYLHTIQSK